MGFGNVVYLLQFRYVCGCLEPALCVTIDWKGVSFCYILLVHVMQVGGVYKKQGHIIFYKMSGHFSSTIHV